MSGAIATIDFEMTALSYEADMIEAGIAMWQPGESIRVWSSLIRPRQDCLWEEEAAAIHRITRDELKDAPEPAVVAAMLNKLLAGTEIAYCGASQYDPVWMRNLFLLADLKPAFRVVGYWSMPGLDIAEQALRIRSWISNTALAEHSAGYNASYLMGAYAYALGFDRPDVVSIQ